MMLFSTLLFMSSSVVLATVARVDTTFAERSAVMDRSSLSPCSSLSFDKNSKTLQRQSCTKAGQVSDSSDHAVKVPNQPPTFKAVQKPPIKALQANCEDNTPEGHAPQLIDATTLCSALPRDFRLPPAYDSTTCRCEVFSIGTAIFAVCNCNPCDGLDFQGDFLTEACNDLKEICIENYYDRGYYVDSAGPAYLTLYGLGSDLDDDVPLYPGC